MATVQLPDPYEGWTSEQLKAHCRKLGGTVMRYQSIILNLADGGMASLTDAGRSEVSRLREAYSDEPSATSNAG